MVSAQFNLQKVAAHRLIADGATYRTEDLDLLVADRVDFHPTDILEDATGGLLVVDTGGWYDLCCPTSRVDQRVAGGGIYRISHIAGTASSQLDEPRVQIDWQATTLGPCLRLLQDPRPWIKRAALMHLATFGDSAVAPLARLVNGEQQLDLGQRLDALWALSWIGTDRALQVIAGEAKRISELQSPVTSEAVSLGQAACHIMALHRCGEASEALRNLAQSPVPSIARTAIEALGRIGSPANSAERGENQSVNTMMSVVEQNSRPSREFDRALEHAILYALIELEDAKALANYLDSRLPDQQRLAMLALEQLGSSEYLKIDWLFKAAQSQNEALRAAAITIVAAHSGWAAESTPRIARCWSRQTERDDELVYQVVRAWRSEQEVEQLVGSWLSDLEPGDSSQRVQKLLACWSHESPPQAWMEHLAKWIVDRPQDIASTLASLDLRKPACRPVVESVLMSLENCHDLELGRLWLSILPARESIRNAWLVEQLVQAADYSLLTKVQITPAQAAAIFSKLPGLNSQQLLLAIETLASVQAEELDAQVLELLPTLPTARTLPEDTLSNLYRNSQPAVRKKAVEVSRLLVKSSPDIEASVQSMLAELEGGDPVRGLEVFRGQKANCSACHQMGYVGGAVGPELTRIGRTRTRSALLESLLFPSARIEQSYGPTKVLTRDGQILNGLVRFENTSIVSLQLAADRVVSIPREDIERLEPSEVSIMPNGLQNVLTRQELADILALLESAR